MEYRSEKIDEIGAALIAVHSQIGTVPKSGVISNNGKDRTYATVEDIIKAISDPCQKNGILVLPWPSIIDGIHVMLLQLLHPASGQFFIGYWPLDDSNKFITGAQARGSGATYAKRYLITNMLRLCVSDETDDDGEEAVTKKQTQSPVWAALNTIKDEKARKEVMTFITSTFAGKLIKDLNSEECEKALAIIKRYNE